MLRDKPHGSNGSWLCVKGQVCGGCKYGSQPHVRLKACIQGKNLALEDAWMHGSFY